MNITEKKSYLLNKSRYDINDLIDLVEILRSEGGCPWDREQTHESIRNDLIEETYEVVEAIDTKNPSLLREELGDLLFQIVFHTQIAREADRFILDDIITDVTAKMIHRHPHVFANVSVTGTGEVLSNWEKIKTEEKQRTTLTDKLRAIPPMLPSLMRAQKVAKKSGVYDEIDRDTLISQMQQTMNKMKENPQSTEDMGAFLLQAAALSQKQGISAEEALHKATNELIDSL